MFNPSRDEARRFLIEAWKKAREGAPASDLERLAAKLVSMHPEYHATLEQPEKFADRDYHPESGDINPFPGLRPFEPDEDSLVTRARALNWLNRHHLLVEREHHRQRD